VEINPESLPYQSVYKLLTGAIVPRPIAWISTVDADGRPNLAPYSFFNGVCSNPPHLLFVASVRDHVPANGDGFKDTLVNVRSTGEFVVNVVTEATVRAMNITAGNYPRGENEFAIAGVTPAPSVRVKPYRVAESPLQFECTVAQIVDVSPLPGGGSIVIGRIVHIHVADELLIGPDKIDIARLQPVGRLAGGAYASIREIFELPRP
jgi:flavin reductase (DIM6/NTAB) family NADH-FMN oxidoreductase RutF